MPNPYFNKASVLAWKKLQIKVEEQDGILLESEWKGVKAKYHIKCSNGHESYVVANSIINCNQGICGKCAKHSSHVKISYLFERFKYQLSLQDATCLEKEWKGIRAKYHIRCKNGHDYWPSAYDVNRGLSACHICAINTDINKNAFYKLLAKQSAICLETEWLGTSKPHRIQCSKGHIVNKRPANALRNSSICKICSNRDSNSTQDKFISILNKSSAECIDDEWYGSNSLYSVKCCIGHITKIRPNYINRKGYWDCPECIYKGFDAFYVLRHIDGQSIKFGITNGNAQTRLMQHMRNGYTEIIILYTNMSFNFPLEIERSIKKLLSIKNYTPICGYEYFSIECLPIVLEAIDKIINTSSEEPMF